MPQRRIGALVALAALVASAAPAMAADMVGIGAQQNPYGLASLWGHGDGIARGTVVALLAMSMGSWYVIITKLIDQIVLQRQAGMAERRSGRRPACTRESRRWGGAAPFVPLSNMCSARGKAARAP